MKSPRFVEFIASVESNVIMRNIAIFLSVGSAALIPLSALGADLPSPAPPPAPVLSQAPASDWRGFYAGSFVGGALSYYSTRQAASSSGGAGGFVTGGLFGYNWQNGAYVYGVEGDITTNSATRKFNAAPGLVGNQVDSIYSLHARARVGYDLGGFMPFLAAGAAYGRNEQLQKAPLDIDGDTHDQLGWTLGAGVDAKVVLPFLGPSTVRGEYLYESFPTQTFDLNGPRMRTDIAAHYARIALISRIGDGWHAPPDLETVDWSGGYAGLLGGGMQNNVSTQGPSGTSKFSASGPIGGVYTGHNWMFGNMVLGYDAATQLANVVGHGAEPGAPATDYRDFIESDFRGRAGYAFGRVLPFAAAGIAYGQSQQVDLITGNERGHVPDFAWTVGAGLDYMLTERIALRAEYLYQHSLSNEETHLDNDNCCEQSRNGSSFRLGAAYFFH